MAPEINDCNEVHAEVRLAGNLMLSNSGILSGIMSRLSRVKGLVLFFFLVLGSL